MTTDRIPLADRARYRWKALLPIFGVDSKFLVDRHGPCPMCEGRDRFRFDDKDGEGTWICSRCGAGKGINLVMEKNGWDFKEAAINVERHLYDAPVEVAKKTGRSAEQTLKLLERTWRESTAIRPDTAAGIYLGRRIGPGPYPPFLRATAKLYCKGQEVGQAATNRPAMLAKVTNLAGERVTIHRTYLTPDGFQAPDLIKTKLVMSPVGPAYQVRLGEPGPVMGIAEGIETALAAARLFDVPCWSALNADGVAKWWPPAGTEKVMIFGDCDASYVGQRAAFALAARLEAKQIKAEVHIPGEVDTDWADIWSRQELVA
jgi:putative DNA primase/helicase